MPPSAASRNADRSAGAPTDPPRLLGRDEPGAAQVHRPDGGSSIVIACDRAGRHIPRALGSLGLTDTELEGHLACDLGIEGVATRLAQRLEAALVLQTYSRLVIDCNRPPDSDESIPTRSEWGQVDGNLHLGPEQVAARRTTVFDPYHAALDSLLEARRDAGGAPILLALYSFAPTWRAIERPWHLGVMHYTDTATAAALLAGLRRDERLRVGDNEPFALREDRDHTLQAHGAARGIRHVGLALRQDLIADDQGQATWAGRLASLLRQVAAA